MLKTPLNGKNSMKKYTIISLSVFFIIAVGFLSYTYYTLRKVQATFLAAQRTSRITNILDGDGDRLRSIALQNTTTVSGAVTIQVDTALPHDWDAGSYEIRAQTFESDQTTGTAPLTIASTTVVSNLNVDQVDGKDETAFLLVDGSRGVSANWDVGSYEIRAQTFESDVTTGTAPLTIASTTVVPNLNVDQVDGKDETDFALLVGRNGGQILIGGTASGNDLTLQSTSDGTKGSIFLGVAGTSVYDEVNDFLGIGVSDPDTEIETAGEIKQRIVSSNVSNPPTDAELDALFTSPATKGDGWTVYIDDSDSDNFYQIVASGTLWFIFTAAKGL
jgi:hypothetical protein